MSVTQLNFNEKNDFTGCKIYIKEIGGKSLADKEGSLKQGDLVLKINGTTLEGLTLKDARKIAFFFSFFIFMVVMCLALGSFCTIPHLLSKLGSVRRSPKLSAEIRRKFAP